MLYTSMVIKVKGSTSSSRCFYIQLSSINVCLGISFISTKVWLLFSCSCLHYFDGMLRAILKCVNWLLILECSLIGEADDCRVDIADPSMETIELSEKVKLDDSCVVVDNKLLHAVSFRAQRHRSYKVSPIPIQNKIKKSKQPWRTHCYKLTACINSFSVSFPKELKTLVNMQILLF